MIPLPAARAFRLSLTTALALVGAYAMGLPLPYLAPIFSLFLASAPGPPMGFKGLVGLLVVVCLLTGTGLFLIPFLQYYPLTGLLLVGVGVFFSYVLSIHKGKGMVGSLLTVGVTLITAAGTMGFGVGIAVVKALAIGISVAVVSHWIVYPFFPEPERLVAPKKDPKPGSAHSNWFAVRATLIVMPAYLLALANPSAYLAGIMKSVSLGQQRSLASARATGIELLGSTFMGGFMAALIWLALKLHPNLWMFFLWVLLFVFFLSMKIYRLSPGRFSASFWINVGVTALILLGPAVEDSANGKDPYAAFLVRFSLFIGITLYAWAAISILDGIHARLSRKRNAITHLEPIPS